MPGLGEKSQQMLAAAGICTPQDLAATGAVPAFVMMESRGLSPSLNFLYAMVGALENRHWLRVKEESRQQLLFELEAARKAVNATEQIQPSESR